MKVFLMVAILVIFVAFLLLVGWAEWKIRKLCSWRDK